MEEGDRYGGEGRQVPQEEVEAAMERYPGFPVTLAVTRYFLDEKMMGGLALVELQAGQSWGNVHAEMVGILVGGVVNKLISGRKKGATIKVAPTDYPDSYGHWDVTLAEVIEELEYVDAEA